MFEPCNKQHAAPHISKKNWTRHLDASHLSIYRLIGGTEFAVSGGSRSLRIV